MLLTPNLSKKLLNLALMYTRLLRYALNIKDNVPVCSRQREHRLTFADHCFRGELANLLHNMSCDRGLSFKVEDIYESTVMENMSLWRSCVYH